MRTLLVLFNSVFVMLHTTVYGNCGIVGHVDVIEKKEVCFLQYAG